MYIGQPFLTPVKHPFLASFFYDHKCRLRIACAGKSFAKIRTTHRVMSSAHGGPRFFDGRTGT